MRHPAYRRLARSTASTAGAAGWPDAPADTEPRYRTAGPSPAGSPPVMREPVCSRCRTFASCCFCDATPDAMRTALRRIAEIHSACRPDCPERRRLATVHTGRLPIGTVRYDGLP